MEKYMQGYEDATLDMKTLGFRTAREAADGMENNNTAYAVGYKTAVNLVSERLAW